MGAFSSGGFKHDPGRRARLRALVASAGIERLGQERDAFLTDQPVDIQQQLQHDAEKLGVPFLGEVPLDAAIRETSDAGRPVVGADPQGAHAAIYLNLAAKVKTLLETQPRRPGPAIVKG